MGLRFFALPFGRALACAPVAPRTRIPIHASPHLRSLASTVAKANTETKLQLRGYQEECIQSVLAAIGNGHKRMGVSLATGSGKTVIFTQLISRIPPRSEAATRTLVLAHRRELVEQAAKHCTRAYPDLRIEVEMGSIHASGVADITIASIQSIISRDRLHKFDPSTFKLVLVDEAHHIVASGYLRTLEHFGLDKKQEGSPTLVGVSATFGRFDGLALGSAIDEIVYHKDYVDMIGEKWLSDVVFTSVESTADISWVKNGANGDFQTSELSRAVNTEAVNEVTVRTWRKKAYDVGRKSTLVFCVDVEHVVALTTRFREHGIGARFVTGDTPKLQRAETLEAFKRGNFPVLVNCGVFTEGTDIPNIDCIVLGRPTRSRNLLVQMIGRGMRLHPDKTNCHIIDMVSSLETGIVTTPTLFGLDPGTVVSEATVQTLREMKVQSDSRAGAEADAQRQHASGPLDDAALSNVSVTFTEYSSIFDLISDTSGERHIHGISPYAWVNVGPGRYMLCNPKNGSYIRLEKVSKDDPLADKAPYQGVEVIAIPILSRGQTPYAAPRQILRAVTFSDAVHGCDKFASEKYPHIFISRDQPWRQNPASTGQLEFLNKLRKSSGQEPLTPANLSKGKAMDMITKIRHGAKGRFAQYETQRRRKERVQLVAERDQAKKLREVVTVGPVIS